MKEILNIFSTREMAVGFWLLIFIFYAVWNKNVRTQLPNLLKAMFSLKLTIGYLTLFIYFILIILLLYKINFWEYRQLKDTIIWFLTVGIISTYTAIGKAKDLNYFKEIIIENIKITVILEFITNMYSYGIILEVILVFLAILLSMCTAVISVSPEFNNENGIKLNKFLSFLLMIIGFLIFLHSVYMVFKHYHEIIFIDFIKDLTLPTILSLAFLLYTYFLVIYCEYEIMFLRFKYCTISSERLRRLLKLRVLLFCNVRIIRVNNFLQRSQIMISPIDNKEDIKDIFRRYKSSTSRNINEDRSFS